MGQAYHIITRGGKCQKLKVWTTRTLTRNTETRIKKLYAQLLVVLYHLYFIRYYPIQEKVKLVYGEKKHKNELRGWDQFFGYTIYFILSFIALLSIILVLSLRYVLNSFLVNKSFSVTISEVIFPEFAIKLEFSKWVIEIFLPSP